MPILIRQSLQDCKRELGEKKFAFFDVGCCFRYDLCKRLEDDNQIPMSQALHKLIQKKDEARLAKLRSFLSVPPTDLQIPSGYVNPAELFMQYSHVDIAQQMTIVDFSWFSDIEARELLNQCWSKPKLQYRARNVLGLINRVNILSYWIPSLILWPEKLAQRVKVGDAKKKKKKRVGVFFPPHVFEITGV